jgi:putative ABC transport system substrate-binding protein
MSIRLRRREFIVGLGGAAGWPIAARGQQRALPVIGYLLVGSPEPSRVVAFHKGLGESGYVEGRNVAIEYRWAHNEVDRLPELAADLVHRRVAVIVTWGIASALAAKAATTTIPIVFGTGADPIQEGLVASLNRPGGNVTGVTGISVEITPKRLGLLHELLPRAARFAVLVNPNDANAASTITDVRAAASTIGRQIEVFPASTNREIETAFASLAQNRADALLVLPSVLFLDRRVQLATLAAHYRMPASYPSRENVEAGGLMSYGASITDRDRQVGIYTGRVLKGDKPVDLPVMQSTSTSIP